MREIEVAHLLRLTMLLAICGSALPPAIAAERVGDALILYALQERTEAIDALEGEMLALIDNSPAEDRFDLYRSYDQLMGTWTQVELAQTLIDEAVSATSSSEEEAIRSTLEDQAQFALGELDDARGYFEREAPSADRWPYLRINLAIRSLLSETRSIFVRILAH